jgi:hypothetical protein
MGSPAGSTCDESRDVSVLDERHRERFRPIELTRARVTQFARRTAARPVVFIAHRRAGIVWRVLPGKIAPAFCIRDALLLFAASDLAT